MVAAQLLDQSRQSGTAPGILLLERQGEIGRGIAYGASYPGFLLNVPASRMSTWPDRPSDFLEWAQRRDSSVTGYQFLPRKWYGDYIEETLRAEAGRRSPQQDFRTLKAEVRSIEREPSGLWRLGLPDGSSILTKVVILAIGHREPADPLQALWQGSRERWIADPWAPAALDPVGPQDPVVILGSGLTAVDATLALTREARVGRIHLVSRNGLLPRSHAPHPVTVEDLGELVSGWLMEPQSLTAHRLLRDVRGRVEQVLSRGGDWRSVVDGLRPHTAAIWTALSDSQRVHFLRRLRPFWEVHRHRMAPEVARRFRSLMDADLVSLCPGKVVQVQGGASQVSVRVADRRQSRWTDLTAGWVLNCTGPLASNSADSNPAIASLLAQGWIVPDSLRLGIQTSAEGLAVTSAGAVLPDLVIVGTLRKPQSWESTAVPELRVQAADAARRALEHFRHQN